MTDRELPSALTVGPREHHLAILHHGKCYAGYFPVGHGIGGKTIELGYDLLELMTVPQ